MVKQKTVSPHMIPQETSMNIRASPLMGNIISQMRESVVLRVNGKKVELKEFPKRALKGTVLGFVKSLNLKEEPREVEIVIRVDEEGSRERRV